MFDEVEEGNDAVEEFTEGACDRWSDGSFPPGRSLSPMMCCMTLNTFTACLLKSRFIASSGLAKGVYERMRLLIRRPDLEAHLLPGHHLRHRYTPAKDEPNPMRREVLLCISRFRELKNIGRQVLWKDRVSATVVKMSRRLCTER